MKKQILVAAFMLLAACFGCHKEHENTIYGEWKTINTVGFAYDYSIQKGGYHCRSLPDVFGTTMFCYDYTEKNDSLFIAANDPEHWVLEYENADLVVVKVHRDSSNTNESFILKRKK